VIAAGVLAVDVSGEPAPLTYLNRFGGPGNEAGQLHGPLAAALDAAGNLYVADSGNHRIQVFGPEGSVIRSWQYSFIYITGIDVDAVRGHVYVADQDANAIRVFDTRGAYIRTIVPEIGPPYSIALHGDLMFVTSNNVVGKLDRDGKALKVWGGFSAGNPGKFYLARGIAVTRKGTVFVADLYNERVQMFTENGDYLGCLGGNCLATPGIFDTPYGVEVDAAGYVYVADERYIHKYTELGAYYLSWGQSGIGPALIGAIDVAVGPEGEVYVVDASTGYVHKYGDSTTPARTTSWGRIKTIFR